jgi:hypothetical protein
MTEYNIFCASKKFNDKNSFQQERYRAFNKVVGEERYEEIFDLIKYDILKDLKLELNKNSWKDEWKKVTQEQWQRLSEIPEFDINVVEMVVGFKPKIEKSLKGKSVKVVVDGKEYNAVIE